MRKLLSLAITREDETGRHKYVFDFEPNARPELLRLLGHWAADPELPFTWRDAHTIAARAEQLCRAHAR